MQTNRLFLLSPTEHYLRQYLQTLPNVTVTNSNLCEKNGADVIVKSSKGLVGYQRKTLPDLIASLLDGRLYKELAQLRTSPIIAYPFIIIEFDPRKTTVDGSFLTVDFSIKSYHSLLTKFQILGIHYLQSPSIQGTVVAIVNSSAYISSANSTELRRPTAPKNSWGQSTNSDYLVYVLQSFPGIGPKVASAIVKYFNTSLPLMWTCDVEDFVKVPGVGRQTAEKLYSFFNVILPKEVMGS